MSEPNNDVIWSVRYVGQADGQVTKILAGAIDRVLDELEDEGKDWTSQDLAERLIVAQDMKPSGAAELAITPERVRKVVALADLDIGGDEALVREVLRADQEARKN